MLAAWGFLEWFFFLAVLGLGGLASLVGLYIAVTFFRNTGYSRTPTAPRR